MEFSVAPMIHRQPRREYAVPAAVAKTCAGVLRMPITNCSDVQLRLKKEKLVSRLFASRAKTTCEDVGVVATTVAGR